MKFEWNAAVKRRPTDRDLLSVLGHELRNPLGAIRNAVEVALRLGTPDPELARQHEIIDRQSRLLSNAVDGLLEFVRRELPSAMRVDWRGGVASRPSASSPPIVLPVPQPRPLRVLVVEDHEDARASLQAVLELRGHRTTLAADGSEGLARLLAERPDVALVDIHLPGLDGYSIARAARDALGPGRPLLIAMTGYGQPEDRARALEAGFDEHLVKPVDLESLFHLMDGSGASPRVA